MTGLQMLLKQLGFEIDVAEVMKQYEQLKAGIPAFAQGLSGKVGEMEARLASIEAKLDAISGPVKDRVIYSPDKEVSNGHNNPSPSE